MRAIAGFMCLLALTACTGKPYHGAWAYSENETWFGVLLEDKNKCQVGFTTGQSKTQAAASGGYWCNYSVEGNVIRIHQVRNRNTGESSPISQPVILTIATSGKSLEVQSAGEWDSRAPFKGKTLTPIPKFPS